MEKLVVEVLIYTEMEMNLYDEIVKEYRAKEDDYKKRNLLISKNS